MSTWRVHLPSLQGVHEPRRRTSSFHVYEEWEQAYPGTVITPFQLSQVMALYSRSPHLSLRDVIRHVVETGMQEFVTDGDVLEVK